MFTASLGIFLLGLLAAAAGGFVGAAIGGNFAFVFTGLCVFFAWGVNVTPVGPALGIDPTIAFNYLAFGPFMGPHVAFAGGAAAAAYAAHKGYIESGKDITSPLAGLGRPSVLLVGAAFGMLGYLIQIGWSKVPWLGGHTDSVAMTVVTSAIIARLMFGNSAVGKASLLNTEKLRVGKKESGGFMGKWDTDDENKWLPYQETPAQFSTIGFFFGMLAAGAALMLAINFPSMAPNAATFGFAWGAVVILFLVNGFDMPVNHHITIIGGLGAVLFMPILAGKADLGFGYYASLKEMDSNTWLVACGALVIGGLAGWFSAMLAEVTQRLFYARGTTHIDPPAMAIWPSTVLLWVLASAMNFAGGF